MFSGMQYYCAVIFSTLLCSTRICIADECDAILRDGVRNTYSGMQIGEFRSSFENSYCQELREANGHSGGASGGIGFKGVSFNFGSNSASNQSREQSNCGNNANSMTDEQFISALEHVADGQIINAWSQCKNSASGLFITGELSGDQLLVLYRFKSSGAVASATIQGRPSYYGVTCDNTVDDGTVINTGGIIQRCVRESEEKPASIVVNSSFSPARLIVPAIIKPDDKITNNTQAPELSRRITKREACEYNFYPKPSFCAGKRWNPVVNDVAPEGTFWCELNPSFTNGRIQHYCLTAASDGNCNCLPNDPRNPQIQYPGPPAYGIVVGEEPDWDSPLSEGGQLTPLPDNIQGDQNRSGPTPGLTPFPNNLGGG